MLKNKKILIIITGSIAAYKALLLIRLLKKKGCEVNCILTKAAEKFITPLSVSSLTGNVVYNELFSLTDEVEMGHIKLARMHDAILVVPATANFISKTASGLANDLASTLILASKVPTFFFPAMNINMWENSIIKDNVRKIVKSGKYIIQGSEGDLACGDYGYGRLSEPEEIIKTLESHFINVKPLFKGVKALVTAGPTQEPIDPVRFISNNSSGIQGYAIARELSNLGAEVSLISGPTNLECPSNIKKLYQVKTATEMYNVCKNNIPRDLFISVAAVTDWKTKKPYKKKLKRNADNRHLVLSENPDILKYVSFHPKRPKLVVGFAAETDSIAKNAKMKIVEKNCDLLVANDISDNIVFGSDMNSVHIYSKKGLLKKIKRMDKASISKKILEDYIYPLLAN